MKLNEYSLHVSENEKMSEEDPGNILGKDTEILGEITIKILLGNEDFDNLNEIN